MKLIGAQTYLQFAGRKRLDRLPFVEERGFSQQFDDKPMSAQRDRSVGSSPSRMETRNRK